MSIREIPKISFGRKKGHQIVACGIVPSNERFITTPSHCNSQKGLLNPMQLNYFSMKENNKQRHLIMKTDEADVNSIAF